MTSRTVYHCTQGPAMDALLRSLAGYCRQGDMFPTYCSFKLAKKAPEVRDIDLVWAQIVGVTRTEELSSDDVIVSGRVHYDQNPRGINRPLYIEMLYDPVGRRMGALAFVLEHGRAVASRDLRDMMHFLTHA